MYGIQEAAAACLLVACVGLLVLFVGWQPQLAACMMIGMLALSRVRKFMKLRGLLGSVLKGFFAFGSFFVWEGESLLAGNSPAGIGEQATGRVDALGEKRCGSCSSSSKLRTACGKCGDRNLASSGSHPRWSVGCFASVKLSQSSLPGLSSGGKSWGSGWLLLCPS